MKLNVNPTNVPETNVSQLYDQLLATQLKHKSTPTFPIHKVLDFDDKGVSDIYQWIDKYIGFPSAGNILDAGCGVGWGASFIAKNTNATITGISLSEDEIKQAKKAHSTSAFPNLSFHRKSFDVVEKSQYAMIIAVESVKHSTDIKQTLQHLLSALIPGGTLIVVEDTYTDNTLDPRLDSFSADWQLSEVLSQTHMDLAYEHNRNNRVEYEQVDFTHCMHTPSKLQLSIQRKVISLLLRFKPKNMGWQAFRGGFTLDMLYAKQKMKYMAHVYRKVS